MKCNFFSNGIKSIKEKMSVENLREKCSLSHLKMWWKNYRSKPQGIMKLCAVLSLYTIIAFNIPAFRIVVDNIDRNWNGVLIFSSVAVLMFVLNYLFYSCVLLHIAVAGTQCGQGCHSLDSYAQCRLSLFNLCVQGVYNRTYNSQCLQYTLFRGFEFLLAFYNCVSAFAISNISTPLTMVSCNKGITNF